MTMFLATAVPELTGGSGISWWQTVGGLVAVFGLLLLCLRLLGRFQRRSNGGKASVLTVWPLGPKREIQVLRLGDAVHYVYRHDGAMVVLDQDTLADWQARAEATHPAAGAPRGLPGFNALKDLRHLKARLTRFGGTDTTGGVPAGRPSPN